ncbi:hypothetical protein GR212_15395 [Rhizobium lusitanum]|uniref:Uncharacterized protein n=1 Tax=Rhizobium lusitanum TaxID=293958 RepID=A0A6L9U8X3_9HYPH|nr:hypothetical protein [Rhizobium lusitanum]NEI70968.1 hypothetical protein [Rhizobium lusitanum]
MTFLGFRSANRAPHSVDYEAIKKNVFHDQDVLIVNINDTNLPWPDRELLKGIGERLYGKKPAKVRDGRKQE